LPRVGALGAAQPVGVLHPVQRAGDVLRVLRHGRVPALEPARGGRAGTSAGRAGRPGGVSRVGAAALAAAAAVWAVLAWLLWQTSEVPSSLHLPHLDPHAYFT